MARYDSLKAAVSAVIQANGNQEITGPVLQSVLLAIINTLGGDIAQNISDIATQGGTLTTLGNTVASQGNTINTQGGAITTLQGQVAGLEPLVVSGTLQLSGTPGQFDFIPDEGEPDYSDVFDAIMANRVVMLYGTYNYGGQTYEMQEVVLAVDENQVRTYSITW